MYFICSSAKYPMIEHLEHRIYNRNVEFAHCWVYSPRSDWAPSCLNTTSASQLESDLEEATYDSSQKIAYHHAKSVSGIRLETILYIHTHIIDVNCFTILDRSLSQTVSRTAQDLSRTQAVRICGGQNGTGTGFLRIHRISSVSIFTPVLHVHPLTVIATS
jgi:hypothetical protein